MNADDKLRAILRMEADTVDPSPAGWDAIHSGVAKRRGRAWWFRGSALAAAALTVAGVVFALDVDRSRDALEPATNDPSVSAGPPTGPQAPTAVPTLAPSDPTPLGAIWPLTTRDEVRAWAADHATYPSLATANGSALAFARNYLGIADAAVTARNGTSGNQPFDVTRPVNGSPRVVSTVFVRGYGDDGGAPFVVALATSAEVTVDRPAAGDAVASPLAAHGTYLAADPAFTVTLRADGPGSAPVSLASGRAVTGPPNVWDVSLPFTTTARTGSLLVTNGSLADSGIASAAAVPVTFGGAGTLPATFVSTRDGRVALFSTAAGALVRHLTEAPSTSGGASGAELSDDGRTVVYTVGAGTCSTEIRSVPVAGGAPTVLVPSTADHALQHASMRGGVLAYQQIVCNGGPMSAGLHEIVVRNGSAAPVVVPVDGEVRTGPVVGARFTVYVTVKNGATTLHTVDVTGERAASPVAPPTGCNWLAATWAAATLSPLEQPIVAAVTCGSQDETGDVRLYRLDTYGASMVLLGHLQSLWVTSLDYSADGLHLLIGMRDSGGPAEWRAYAYEGGTPHEIPGILTHPTWR